MPITGFLSVEGGSQRNGAVMALEQAPGGMKVDFPIFDTGTSATGAATALDKALSNHKAIAAAVTVFGTEMVAMMPIAAEYKVPLLTISGLAKITESGNPYIFRFLPNDREIKVAHARYMVEVMKKTKIALISDTTAYGQGGFALLAGRFHKAWRKAGVRRQLDRARHEGHVAAARQSESIRRRRYRAPLGRDADDADHQATQIAAGSISRS